MKRSSVIRLLLTFLLLVSPAFSSISGQSFSVSGPQSLTVYPGTQNPGIDVGVSSSTYSGPVNVTITGLPTGITAAPDVLTLTPGSYGRFSLLVGPHADAEDFPATSPAGPYSATRTISIVGNVGSTKVSTPIKLTVSLDNSDYVPEGSFALPVVQIDTTPKDPILSADVSGTVTITNSDGSTTILPGPASSDNTASIRLYGNSNTVLRPKLDYHVRLNATIDLLSKLGITCPYVAASGISVCDSSREYVLLANYDDKSLLRNWSASALANRIPYGGAFLDSTPLPSSATGTIPTPSGDSRRMPWAPHSIFVEVFVNGRYKGLYQLAEEVRIDSHRVNVKALAETQSSGDVTGGYLLKIDQDKDGAYVFTTPRGLPVNLVQPDYSPHAEVPEQTSYISQYVNSAESALFSATFTDPATGWQAYFDRASAVNFYLVNEIMGNVGGGDFTHNAYLHKAADDPFLYMGPVWSFDVSAGNANFEPIVNPTVPWVQNKALWYTQLFKDPTFKAAVTKQFNALKQNGVFDDWISSITTTAGVLNAAQSKNYTRWPILGIHVWPNAYVGESYSDEATFLTRYIKLRVAYLDAVLNGKAKTTTVLSVPSASFHQDDPQTLTAHVTGGSSLSGTVSFFSGQVLIETAAIGATGLATVRTNRFVLGTTTLSAVYSGDDVNALSSSTPVSVTIAPARIPTSALLTSSATEVSAGTPLTLTVVVVPNGSTTKQPSGTVAFTSSNGPLGSVPVVNGVATLVLNSLVAGTNRISATYWGDTGFVPAFSNGVTVTSSSTATPVTVTFGTQPNSLSVIVDGTGYGVGLVAHLLPGSVHTISAPSPQPGNQVFVSWSDGGAQTHTITIPSHDVSYYATFTTGASTGPGTINLGGGFSAGSVSVNGAAKLNGSRLRLTDGGLNQIASSFFPTPVSAKAFTTEFVFQLTSALADGFTFTLQNQGPSAIGAFGLDLGYRTVTKSVAIKFDIYNNAGEGTSSTGLYTGGGRPTVPSTDLKASGIDLRSGHAFKAGLSYNGTTLTVTITDTVTNQVATQSYTVDIPALVGGPTAYAGFTAGTGSSSAVQEILAWTLTNTASPSPSPAVNYFNGFPNGSISLNNAGLSDTRLRLTDGRLNQASGAFYPGKVNVQSFTTDFTFQLSNAKADGFMFVLQNQGPVALGTFGIDLGYRTLAKSVGIKFDLYNNSGEGPNSTGLFTNGARPTVPGIDLTPNGIDLHSGNPFHVHMVYDGVTLSVTIQDTVTAKIATQSYIVNIPSAVGSSTAYVGFTAGTGASTATQDILNWTLSNP